MRQQRVEGLAAVPRRPFGPVRVVPERALEFERLAAVVGAEHRTGLGAGPDHVLAESGLELPDPLDRGVGVVGEAHPSLGGRLPAGAEVVGPADLWSDPARGGADEQPGCVATGVDHAGVDLLHVEVRTVPGPLLAGLVGCADPESLASADQQLRLLACCHIVSASVLRTASPPAPVQTLGLLRTHRSTLPRRKVRQYAPVTTCSSGAPAA